MRKRQPMKILSGVGRALFLCLVSVIVLMPLAYAIFASFKTNTELFVGSANLFPKEWRFDNYVEAWTRAKFARYTLNSVIFASGSALLAVFNATMVGYVFARGRFPGRRPIILLFTSSMFISVGVLTLFPVLEVARALGISHSLWGLILINGIGVNIASYWLVNRYIATLPAEMDEAAMVDGCGFFSVWWRIVFPLCRPVAATVGLLAFLGAWNEYLRPLIFTLGNEDMSPLTVGIVSLRTSAITNTSYGLMLAGATLSLVPLILMFITVNKYFVQGLTQGALKG